ncbi:MAG: PIN domain-containing protein [Synechococcaceae bacterium WBB_10_009]|nr:PIN domain-containing protein [Synechococcaceae bacterium WBB_10_009]
MLYLDTCVLLAVLTPEVHTQVATQALAQAPSAPAISPWTTTELHSALGLKVRTGALTNSQADAVLDAYQHTLVPALVMLEIEVRDFRHADALHLAIAVGRGATLCSLDAGLVGAAKGLGLPAQLLTTPA